MEDEIVNKIKKSQLEKPKIDGRSKQRTEAQKRVAQKLRKYQRADESVCARLVVAKGRGRTGRSTEMV